MSLSTTNTNSSSITFYCPNNLKTNFDDLVKFKRISRTSIINLLMEKWIRSEYEMMKKDDQIQSLIRDVKVRHHINKPIKVNKASQDKRTQEVGANIFCGNLTNSVDEK